MRGADHVALALAPGELLLSGENGAGKTTLMRILAGLEQPNAGRFDLGRGACAWRAARKALLSQHVYLHQSPYLFDGSVTRNLAYALPPRPRPG